MRGNPQVIAALNAACASELRAQAQYRQDAAVLDNMGLPALAKVATEYAGAEMAHLSENLARITFLEGSPAFQPTPTEYHGDVRSILAGNIALELQARNDYQDLVDLAMEQRDTVTRALVEDSTRDEEGHLNFWEGELMLLDLVGEQDYVSAWKAKE
jgi:bacterioferritin